MHQLTEKLAACGLEVQAAKTQLWHSPTQQAVASAVAAELQCEKVDTGLTMCGYSLYTKEEEELPLGGGSYMKIS